MSHTCMYTHRCIAVHPTLPVFLTSSDDTLIKLWDWDKGFACVQQFEGHSHFVMQVCIAMWVGECVGGTACSSYRATHTL